ncbi:MAG: ABC transporter permease [Spongiibacteraceae bacterium]
MRDFSIAPREMYASLWRNRNLIKQMTRREVLGLYRGSILGLAWSFFHPILMLAVYTFVFSVVFKARWGVGVGGEEGRANFAILVFVGMIVHSLFSECLSKAPDLVLTNTNYVKKVVFPLEVLPAISLSTALFHTTISLLVLITTIAATSQLYWTVLLIPIVLLPLAILAIGIAWLLASMGVFIRDVGQGIGILITVMMFLSPMFYPIDALPETIRPLIMLNPLSLIMEQARAVLVWGKMPDWQALGIYTAIACAVAWMGFAWFQKTRKGFADVL